MAQLHSLIPMLKVANLGNTIRFYCETLGFRVVGCWPDEQNPAWCKLESGGATVMFYEESGNPRPRPSMTGVLYIGLDDLDAMHGRVKDKVEIEWGPEVYEYGMREFAIRDCNGYLVSFGQEVDVEAPA